MFLERHMVCVSIENDGFGRVKMSELAIFEVKVQTCNLQTATNVFVQQSARANPNIQQGLSRLGVDFTKNEVA